MTQAGIPLGYLVTFVQHWARHLYLRPLPGTWWVEDAGSRGRGSGLRPGYIPTPWPGFFQGLESRWESRRESTGKKKGEERDKRQVWWVE